jgi:phage-related minor tail protein
MKKLIFIALIFAFGFMGYQFVQGFMDNFDAALNSFSSISDVDSSEFGGILSKVQSIGAGTTDDHTFRNLLVSGCLVLTAMDL